MSASAPVRLAELTWPQVRVRVDAGWTTIILPLGATEQHGLHLPLSVDTEIAGHLAEAVAARLGRCLVAPVVALGCSAHHLAFAGSMSLSHDTLARVIVESCQSLALHGFRRILVVSGHAGNVPAMRQAVESLGTPDGYTVEAFSDWARYRAPLYAVGAEAGMTPPQIGSHAGHYETALMLRMRPALVRMTEARRGYIGEPAESGARLRAGGMQSLSDIGVIGDPTGATAALGDRYFDAMVGAMVTYFSSGAAAAAGAGRTA
ncbi:MAG TPA: creatininase family protein [Candidatus Limnocylindria bacterium]|nr:creatininase family protein [Candidatus Limnocylindria bacterium]